VSNPTGERREEVDDMRRVVGGNLDFKLLRTELRSIA
jgi:hypothetical protein